MKIFHRSLRRRTVLYTLSLFTAACVCNRLVDFARSASNTIDVDSSDTSSKMFSSTHIGPKPFNYWDSVFGAKIPMTSTQIIDYFKWTNRESCQLVQYFGGFLRGNPRAKDGIKAVCLDPQITPEDVDCLVYSFGINFDWTFDEDMERFGCEVFCFDPSINKSHHDHAPYIHFFNWGLGHFNGYGTGSKKTWKMHTLSYIYEELSKYHGKNRTIDYLKLDIEGDEWNVIPEMIKSGVLAKVRQLAVEIHLKPSDPIERFHEQVNILRSLETAGMIRFDSMYNPWVVESFPALNLKASSAWDLSFFNSRYVSSLVES